MHRWRALGALGLLLALLLSGCGGGSPHSARPGQSTQRPRASTPPAPTPVDLTVEVNGDLLIHSPVWQRAAAYGHGRFDFSPMLREIAPFIRQADLAICHVE